MNINNVVVTLFSIGLLIFFMYSMNAWFASFILNFKILVYIPFCMCLGIVPFYKLFNINSKKIILSIIYVYALFYLKLGSYILLTPVVLYIFLTKEVQYDVYHKLTKYLAILLSISLSLHIIIRFVDVSPFLPPYVTETYGIYDNYFFYIRHHGDYAERYNAFFNEPGHLGMIMAFLVYVNDFNLRDKYTLIFFVNLLFSLSLAGYILLIVGFIIRLYYTKREMVGQFLFAIFLLCFVGYLATIYDNGNNMINEHIIERLTYDEDNGIKGNNRTERLTDDYFESLTLKTGFLGLMDAEIMEQQGITGAGYKIFLIQYGIWGLLLILCLYYNIYRFNKTENDIILIGYFLVLVLAFVQRAYPLWTSWLIPTIYMCMNCKVYKH